MNILRFPLSAFFLTTTMFAVDNTEANRIKAADRYLRATPISEMMSDMVTQMGKGQPADKQFWIKNIFDNYLDYQAIEKIMKDSMVNNFSADEIDALADFYSSPNGKSVMKKFGVMMSEAMPLIQSEILKAVSKSNMVLPKSK